MLGGRKYLWIFLILWGGCQLGIEPAQGVRWETLPPDHWAYAEIRWLQALGYLRDLNPSHKPYTRGEIADGLQSSPRSTTGPAQGRFQLLEEEFSPEMIRTEGWELFTGVRVFTGMEAAHGQEGREAGYGVLNVAVGNPRLGIFTALRADRDLAECETYKGKIWSECAGLTEQAYAVAFGHNRRWEVKMGRDHRYWGPGDDHLLLNYGARGLDQISVRVRWTWGEFTALVGQLDDYEDSTGVRTSRFLSGHRLELIPWEQLRIGISETLLFSGDVRLGSMNPFLPYYGELVNENSEGNGLIGLDVVAYPHPGLEAFGELLLDDIQVEKKEPADLEPTEWGWLVGLRWAGWGGLLGAGISYCGVTNRTYNAVEPRYRYTNYGLPLGSQLGNDGDKLRLEMACWPDARLRFNPFWEFRRQGEGRVSAEFDTSYAFYTVDEGYREPFPTGVVEKAHTLGLWVSALPHRFIQFEGWIGYNWVEDAEHVSEQTEEGFRGRATLNVRFDHLNLFP